MAAHIEKAAGNKDDNQDQRKDNQKVANLHYGTLEMGNAAGASH